MTTEQTAQQLELAAQILRTGHPWEFKGIEEWHSFSKYPKARPEACIFHGQEIRPILATPPDNRPLHNPDKLTAEQVGVGWRLVVKEDSCDQLHELWCPVNQGWIKGATMDCTFEGLGYSYRLPLSVPWPEPQPDPYAELKKAHAEGKVIECITGTDRRWMAMQGEPRWFLPVEDYRIKPDAPPFQLPPPPPGMQWHRTDGWQEGDLPEGWRPLVTNEDGEVGDEWFSWLEQNWKYCNEADRNVASTSRKHRTRRPLIFTHSGKTWTWHRPGDPTPCNAACKVFVLFQDGGAMERQQSAEDWSWGQHTTYDTIIGWRYADENKTVPLGPEDVKPFTVIRRKGEAQTWHWRTVSYVDAVKVTCGNRGYGWAELASDYERNESLTTGKWNPDAWEPCHKTIEQNG